MAYNYTMTVNATGNDEQLIAQTVCKEIVVGEDEDSATPFPSVDWQFKTPSATQYSKKLAGTKQIFRREGGAFFRPGEVIADLATLSGSATFSVVEN